MAIRRFRKEYPSVSQELLNEQILCIFRLYRLNTERSYSGSNQSMLYAGTMLIFICTLFMHCGASMYFNNKAAVIRNWEHIHNHNEMLSNSIVMNTIISSASSGLVIVMMATKENLLQDKLRIQQTQLLMRFNPDVLFNGVLAGLVSVAAGCQRVSIWASLVIGVVGGSIFYASNILLKRYEIDDPLHVT